MSIHVSPGLDQDQRICRPISFYDLVELVTYGRLSFNQSAKVRLTSLRPPKRNKSRPSDTTTKATSAPKKVAAAAAASTTVVYQSWGLLEHEHSIDWSNDDASAPSIHIVSTIHALSESLFVGEGMQASIDRTSRFLTGPEQQQSTHSAEPMMDDDTLRVTLWPRERDASEDQDLMLRLPIDLKTLLRGVLISPLAPTRFVELVSHLVQRISHANVSRASLC